jgi:hypothetical protein
LLFLTSENRSSFSDILGYINIIQRETGKLERSRCLSVHPDAVQVAERMHVKSKLPVKLRSVGKSLVPVVLSQNSIMT